MAIAELVTGPAAHSEQCACILREALKAAERGEMRALLIVTLASDRSVETAYETGDSFMTLVGATTVAIRDMIEAASE